MREQIYKDMPLYTKEIDGTIQRWFVWSMSDEHFAVSAKKNATLSSYHKYYLYADIGKTIFKTRKEAAAYIQ